MVATRNRKPTEITSVAIYHCTEKATGRECYMVKSDSSNEYYRVTWNAVSNEWMCPCKSIKPCKHIRAVVEVIQERHFYAFQAALDVQMEAEWQESRQEPDSQYERETFGMSGDECAKAIEIAKQNMYGPNWREREEERARYREFEFQMGSYSIPGLY